MTRLRSLALRGLADRDPFVARAAVDAIGKHPRPDEVAALLELWHRTPDSDVHLRHAVRLALLEMITLPGTLAHWAASGPGDEDFALMAGVALALPNDEAGAFLINYLRTHRVAPEVMGPLLTHAAKHLPKDVDVSALGRDRPERCGRGPRPPARSADGRTRRVAESLAGGAGVDQGMGHDAGTSTAGVGCRG